MTKRMLIDATHPEETRVVVVNGNRLEEFDFETSTKKQNKGNIYLAKVTRVEPSLQAAFIEYGGNRHGFLAFSEIHPDYYRIPYEDRMAVLAEESAAGEAAEVEIESEISEEPGARDRDGKTARKRRSGWQKAATPESAGAPIGRVSERSASEENRSETENGGATERADADRNDPDIGTPDIGGDKFAHPEAILDAATEDLTSEHPASRKSAPDAGSNGIDSNGADQADEVEAKPDNDAPETDDLEESALRSRRRRNDPRRNAYGRVRSANASSSEVVETIGGDETDEETEARRPLNLHRKYKIQEVIKRRQILLVQVSKEERGNKGAALTTYLSLAGRYCVLMPNTSRGGGISRKIGSGADRKRLKSILDDLEIPKGMAVIVRTAGSERGKAEIKRDYDYLLRLWEEIRQTTLASTAPTPIHEEGNLIKRSIRDLYAKEIEEIQVEGENGHKSAKAFMKMLIPSHARRVKLYDDSEIPLFQRYRIESQLDVIYSPTVQLKSGGYIVLNQTEALVAIDVNSGRATRERHIEETALKTNIEAAEEIARQLRLRDLAGLIVIDFIDMGEARNNAQVERRLTEAMRRDRARIQIGRIGPFGLLELSRQRLRPSLIEAHSEICRQCGGIGLVRSTESSALHVLRAIEEEGLRKRSRSVTVHVHPNVGFYLLNQKRDAVARIERRYAISVFVESDVALAPPAHRIERVVIGPEETDDDREQQVESVKPHRGQSRHDSEPDDRVTDVVDADRDESEQSLADGGVRQDADTDTEDDSDGRKRRRRGRRGGRRRGRRGGEGETGELVAESAGPEVEPEDIEPEGGVAAEPSAENEAASAHDEAPTKSRRGRRKKSIPADAAAADGAAAQTLPLISADEKTPTAKSPRRRRANGESLLDRDSAANEKPKQAASSRTRKAVGDDAKSDADPANNGSGADAVLKSPETGTPPASADISGSGNQPAPTVDRPKKKGWWNLISGAK